MTSVVDDAPLRPPAHHALWCTDHYDDPDDPNNLEMSWCRGDKRTIGGIETSLTEALDGTVEIYVQDNGADSMSLEAARSLRARLEDLERQATPADRSTLNALATMATAAGFHVTEETWAGIRTQSDAHAMSRALGEWIGAATTSTPATAGDDRMLSIPEAAEMLNARRYPVGMMCRSGELPAFKISGRWGDPSIGRPAVHRRRCRATQRRGDGMTTIDTAIGALALRDQILAEADAAAAPMPPCPAWCTLRPGHAWDSLSDRGPVRSHEGPEFGPHLVVGADEFADARGVLVHDVMTCSDFGTKMSPDDLRDLARRALAAADWLEGQPATARKESA